MREERAFVRPLLTEPDYDERGFVNYARESHTYRLWYGKIGCYDVPPALVLHGGPGGNHYNLVAFQALSNERSVIFYDQLGCGQSDRPVDSSLWTADRYFDEVEFVRDGLGLQKFHLIAHSWGTTVAVGFAAKHPDGILSLSLHSPILSFPYYVRRVARVLKQNLSGFHGTAGQIIDDFELRGKGQKGAYDAACLEFVKKHVTHTWPLPEAMKRLIAARNSAVHDVMVASDSELNVLGNLKTVNVTPQLSELDLPVLMTCGSDDLCTPSYTKWQSEFATDPRYHIIEGSAHMTPVDAPTKLLTLQRVFLRAAERRPKHIVHTTR